MLRIPATSAQQIGAQPLNANLTAYANAADAAARRALIDAAKADLTNTEAQSWWKARVRQLLLTNPLRTVVPAGDSITQASDYVGTGTNNWNLSPSSWCNAALLNSGKFRYIRNAGVAGNTSTQLLDRFNADVLAYAPDVCLILIGTNDYGSSGTITNAAVQTLFQNKEEMVKRCINAGTLPVIVVPPPRNNAQEPSRRCRVFDYLLADYYGLPLIDLYALCADASTGQYKSGYSGDGIHPNTVCTAAIYPTISTILSDLKGAIAPPYIGIYDETASGAGFSNSVRSGAFTSVNGSGVPSNWGLPGVLPAATTAEASGYPYSGNEYTFTASGSGGNILFGSSAVVAEGDEIWLSGHVSLSGLDASVSTSHSWGIDYPSARRARALNDWNINGNFRPFLKSVVPPGATSFTPFFFLSGSPTGVFKVKNFTALNVTAARAIWTPAG